MLKHKLSLLLLPVVLAGCTSNIAIKNSALYWPNGDGTAEETFVLSDATRHVDATEWKALETDTVAMRWESYKWIRIAIEQMCSQLEKVDAGARCVKEDIEQALKRVEGSAKRFGRRKR